jgi:hypothetical protein
MFSNNIKLKIKENKVTDKVTPRFIISYTVQKNSSEDASQISHKIISLLNENKDIFVEVNSSLLSVLSAEREKETLDFIQQIKSMKLEYRYRQLPGRSSGNVFSNFLKRTPSVDHEILALIPKEVWSDASFKAILPEYGIRYYICREAVDTNKVLDDMYKGFLLDSEKLDFFKYIVFDCSSLCQMGILTNTSTLVELQRILL